jgi:type II secretory pathway pseudopilin PulG
MLLLGIVVTAGLYSFITRDNGIREENAQTERALALAKDALIGYASARPTDKADRPGELPCPDMDNNGQSDDGQCDTVATQIGRFPWITLRTPDLRDASGERLWYAVSNNFRDNPRVVPLNSTTPGQLTVTGISPASNAIAIVFAPGSVVTGQSRSASNLNNVAHYLEGENANGDTVFTTAASSGTFNVFPSGGNESGPRTS